LQKFYFHEAKLKDLPKVKTQFAMWKILVGHPEIKNKLQLKARIKNLGIELH